MSLPCVVLQTDRKSCFSFENGYEGITILELQTLLKLGRETVRSLEAELEKRGVVARLETSNKVKDCADKLRRTVEIIKTLERLETRGPGLVNTAVQVLETKQTSRDSKIYQAFLRDILHHCGPGTTLLCAAGLGKQRIISLNAPERTELVQYIKSHKTALESPILDKLALEYKIGNDSGSSLILCSRERH
jgi:hypothetical protein